MRCGEKCETRMNRRLPALTPPFGDTQRHQSSSIAAGPKKRRKNSRFLEFSGTIAINRTGRPPL
jgi:hypothetical protein